MCRLVWEQMIEFNSLDFNVEKNEGPVVEGVNHSGYLSRVSKLPHNFVILERQTTSPRKQTNQNTKEEE